MSLHTAAVDETTRFGSGAGHPGVHEDLRHVHQAVLIRRQIGREDGGVGREAVLLELEIEVGLAASAATSS